MFRGVTVQASAAGDGSGEEEGKSHGSRFCPDKAVSHVTTAHASTPQRQRGQLIKLGSGTPLWGNYFYTQVRPQNVIVNVMNTIIAFVQQLIF